MNRVPYRTGMGDLIKNDPIWIPTRPGMSLFLPDIHSYNASGKETRGDHHWLIISETPSYVDAVMTTTLVSAREEKHRATRSAIFNDESYVEPIIGNQCPPFPSPYEKEIGICYDTVISIPKQLIYAAKGVRIDADGQLLDKTVLDQIRKGCYQTMEEINYGFPHDPYDINDDKWNPESTYRPQLRQDKDGELVYPHPVQQVIVKAQELQQKEIEETKNLKKAVPKYSDVRKKIEETQSFKAERKIQKAEKTKDLPEKSEMEQKNNKRSDAGPGE